MAVAIKVLAPEIVQDGRTIGDSVAAAQYQVLSRCVGNAQARRHLLKVPILEGRAVDASRATAQDFLGPRAIVRSGVRQSGIESGLTIVCFLLGKRYLPPDSDVESELGGRPPVVLGKKSEQARAIARLRGVDGFARRVRGAHQEGREGMTGGFGEAGKIRGDAVELEGSRQVRRFIGVVAVAEKLAAELQAVPAARIGVGILVIVALRGVRVMASHTDPADKLHTRITVAERHAWQASIGNTRNPHLRCEFGVIGDVVGVLKAVVTQREDIHRMLIDRPGVLEAYLRSSHFLLLVGVDGLSRERWEGRAVAVVPVANVI